MFFFPSLLFFFLWCLITRRIGLRFSVHIGLQGLDKKRLFMICFSTFLGKHILLGLVMEKLPFFVIFNLNLISISIRSHM